jgi:AP-2 complex subunit alpha
MNLASLAANLEALGKTASEYAAGAPSLDLNALVSSQPRGLYNFISEIRNAKSKDEERSRVDKELANIRVKFANSANLTSRDKKKYVWKMCYMYMLGYDIDFGHLEFISLLSSSKFQEKSVGYMAFSLMMRPGDELMTLVVNSMRNDLIGQLVHGQTLALAAVSNIGGNDLAEALAGDVQRLVVGTMETKQYNNVAISAEEEIRNKSLVSKKATLCLLRLYRTNPDCLVLEDWLKRMARLLEDRDLGVVTSVMSLLLGLASSNTAFFEPLVPYVISILNRLVVTRSCSADYLYYRTPCPWLQVKCLRLLQYYKMPTDGTQGELLNEVLGNILIKTDVSDSQNKSNADHSILFEAVNLVILYGPEAAAYLKDQVCTLLGRFIAVKDPNIRYLGLDAMTRMAKQDGPEAVQMHQSTVLESLKDTDISVRKRALNLLFVLTDKNNAQGIVSDLLSHLAEADSAMKEDIVVKIAILAEKFSADLHWYVNTMVQVIVVAGDYVAEAVWYRVVQIVINNAAIHEYAAQKMLTSVEGKYAHDNVVAIAAYLLGEIGVNICEQPGMSGFDQLNALNQHMGNCSVKVQAILLTTYMKLLNLYPEQVADQVKEIFNRFATSCHLELQQRACEYLALPGIAADTMEAVLNPMPPFEMAGKESALLALTAASSSHSSGVSADKVASATPTKPQQHESAENTPVREVASIQKVRQDRNALSQQLRL